MPAIIDAPNVKKVPVRDFDAKRGISLHWNEDVAEDRLVGSLPLPPRTTGHHRTGKVPLDRHDQTSS
jgi:hypothetical protein